MLVQKQGREEGVTWVRLRDALLRPEVVCRTGSTGATKPTAHQLSCVLHGWCTTALAATLSLGSVKITHPENCSISLEEGEPHPEEMVWWNGNTFGWKRCITSWNELQAVRYICPWAVWMPVRFRREWPQGWTEMHPVTWTEPPTCDHCLSTAEAQLGRLDVHSFQRWGALNHSCTEGLETVYPWICVRMHSLHASLIQRPFWPEELHIDVIPWITL